MNSASHGMGGDRKLKRAKRMVAEGNGYHHKPKKNSDK